MSVASILRSNIVKIELRGFVRWLHHKYKSHEGVDPMPSKYGGKSNVTILPGIGIGPEIMSSTLKILEAAEAPLTYEIMEALPDDDDEHFQQVLISIRRNKVALKGNIEIRSKDVTVKSRNIQLRKMLDLYVYCLPCRTYPGITTKYPHVDLVVIRQNTEGEYLMLEHEPRNGSVEALKVLTAYNTERVAEYAYEYAIANNRKHVTVLHTADVLKLTEGVFLSSALKVSHRYPQVLTKVKEAGAAACEIVTKPQKYDVVLATNLNGSIIGNCVNGMIGGPAVSAGLNYGSTGIAVFEPGVRNKGTGIVNQGIANPTAMIMAACDLLDHLGYFSCSEVIKTALYRSLVFDRLYTKDLGGNATTNQVTDNIIRHVKSIIGRPGRTPESKIKYLRWKAICNPNGN